MSYPVRISAVGLIVATAARGDVCTGNRYHVEYHGLRDDRPATVTINVHRGVD